MDMASLQAVLVGLSAGIKKDIYVTKIGEKVTVTQTGKYSPHDFVVGLLRNGESEFNPTHIRLLIDIYIKRESNKRDFETFFAKMEEVYNGAAPEQFSEELRVLNFPMQLDSSESNLCVAQLLMIEQDINFGPQSSKPSKMNPPREYLMRYFRWVASGEASIDRIIFAAAGRKYPASEKYSKPHKAV